MLFLPAKLLRMIESKTMNLRRLACCLILSVPACAWSQIASLPTATDFRDGERWEWRRLDGLTKLETSTQGRTSVLSGERIDFVDSSNHHATIEQVYSSGGWRQWPLRIGRTWKVKYDWRSSMDEPGTTAQTATVAAYESVTVPAGTFMAFRIEYRGSWSITDVRHMNWAGESEDTYWYAPDAKADVKELHVSYGRHGSERWIAELTSHVRPDIAPREAERAVRAAAEASTELKASDDDVHQRLAGVVDGRERDRLLSDLGAAYERAGAQTAAWRVYDEIVNDAKIGAGRRSLRASQLAYAWMLANDPQRGRRYLARAKELAAMTTDDERETLAEVPEYAILNAEVELARRSDKRQDTALVKSREKAELVWADFNDTKLSASRRTAAAQEMLNGAFQHVRVLVQNSRRQEALAYSQEIEQRIASRPELKPDPEQSVRVHQALGYALATQGDYEGAVIPLDAAIATCTNEGLPDSNGSCGDARRQRVMSMLALDRIAGDRDDVDAWVRGRTTNPALANAQIEGEAESLILASAGRWSDAITQITRAIDRSIQIYGTDDPYVKYREDMRLLYRFNDPTQPPTEDDIRRFVAGIVADDVDWGESSYSAFLDDATLAHAMSFLMDDRRHPPSPSAVELAFRISESLRSGSSQSALAEGAARMAAADPKLRALIESEQAMRFEQNRARRDAAIDRARTAGLPRTDDPLVSQRQFAGVDNVEQAITARAARLKSLQRDIAAQYPAYREAVSPRIPDAAAIGAALRPGEAYLNFYAGATASYAFVVLPGGKLVGKRLPVTRETTRKLIAALRKPFDEGMLPEREGDLAGFDLAASSALFDAWIAPVRDDLIGVSTIYLSAADVLSNLPWNVLVTNHATTLADASWWIATTTPVQMPSASSLLLARKPGGRSAALPFEAFADPSFDGNDRASLVRAGTRSVREPAVTRGSPPPEVDYRKLNPLPETRDETEAIAASLHADPRSVIYGVAASRSRVMKEDLSNVRVLAFATHGLLPGELPGMTKAGLALAYEGRGLADSVLTIDDIVNLRLNADWVILSACNTGYASGGAGDSMSALSRGFFIAGTRTLLTTQWAVESQSAKEITVGLFENLATDPRLSKGDALARTQREMIAGRHGERYRHPFFWAAYFLSGDASR